MCCLLSDLQIHKPRMTLTFFPFLHRLQKDRVSILSHTIDYIRQLKDEVAQLQEKCASSVLGHQQGGTTTTIDKVQPPANVTISKHAPKEEEEEDFEGGLCFGSMTDLLKVAVYPDNKDGMVIKVDTNNNQTQMLIQILTTSRDLGLEVRWFNSKFIDNRMHVTLTATVCPPYLCLSPPLTCFFHLCKIIIDQPLSLSLSLSLMHTSFINGKSYLQVFFISILQFLD
jgi:hypothetical protein